MSARREPSGWQRIAGIVFVTAAFLFLGYLVAVNTGELRAHEWSIRPGLLGLSLLLNILGLIWGIGVWRLLLRRLGTRVSMLDLARVWFVSGLGRYIPGKIWQFVGAAHLGVASGMSPTVTITSLAANTLFFLLGAFLTAVYLAPVPSGEVAGVAVGALRWLAPLTLLLVHPRMIRAALNVVRRIARKELGDWTGRWIDGIWLVVLSLVGWGLTGVALYLFVISLTPLSLVAAPAIIGMNALSFVAGYIVFFVPAGLGAKEGVLAALLSLYVPAPVAALLAVATRLWLIAAEVVPALLLLRRNRGKSTLKTL